MNYKIVFHALDVIKTVRKEYSSIEYPPETLLCFVQKHNANKLRQAEEKIKTMRNVIRRHL